MVQPHPALDFLNGRFCFCRATAHCLHRLSFFGFGCLQLQLLAGQMKLTTLQKNSLRLGEPEASGKLLMT
jgi:hypothetical protein